MNKSKRMISLLVLSIVLISASSNVHAADIAKVTGYEKIVWGITTGRYYVNGIHAFCSQYQRACPEVGMEFESVVLCDNDIMRKALYYGYNGPKNTLGTDARAHILTAIALSDANIGERATGVKAKYDVFYWDLVNNPSKYPSPPSNFKAYLAITASDEVQDLAYYVLEELPPVIPDPVYEVEIIKYQTGTELGIPGVVFEYTGPDGNKKNVTTDGKGKILLSGLKQGTHTIREVSVMDGYELRDEIYKFVIDEESESKITIPVYNELAPYDVILHKEDVYGNQLCDAMFSLYSDAECTQEVENGITDANGILQFENLEIGTIYYLKETKAPTGYQISEKVYELYALSTPVNDEFLFFLNGTADDADSAEQYSIDGTKANREVNITMKNDVGYVLPNTGSSATIAMPLLGILLCGMSACSRNKKQTKNKQ